MALQVTKYWVSWLLAAFLTFIVPELWAIVSGHPEKTLSAVIWRAERLGSGNPLHWTFIHLMVTIVLFVGLGWLVGHFGWGIWK